MSIRVRVGAGSGNGRWPCTDRHRETDLGSRVPSIRAIRAAAREQVTAEEQKRRSGDLHRQQGLRLATGVGSPHRRTLQVNHRLVSVGLPPE